MLVYAYIDESGDPGIARGTKWLIVGCAVVDARWREQIEDVLVALSVRVSGERALHFKDMSHENKKGCYQHIVKPQWWGIIAIADTAALLPKRLRNPKILHYEVLKEIVRRVLWRAEEFSEVPDIVIDTRHRRFDIEGFRDYLENVNRDDDPHTNWDFLDPERVVTAEPDDEFCLSLADGLAHATYKALEPNEFSGPESTYLEICLPKIWKGKGELTDSHAWHRHPRPSRLLGNGIILLPESDLPRFLREGFHWTLR